MTVYWPNGSLDRPRVSSDFDAARKNPVTGIVQPHNGIDLVGWTDNCSPVDGTVVFAGYNGGAGNEVRIRADGPTAFHVGDHYRILHHASLYVSTGQRVKARQPVGRMGTTGQSTGVHCHFETHEWRLWNPVNPTDYMRRANAGESAAGGDSTPFVPKEWDEMASKDEVKSAVREVLGERRVSHTGAPINFRSTTGGVSYTMTPGIQIIRHENEIAAALTLEFVTGEKYPGADATQQQREAIGERQINDAEILVILSKFGFEWASRDIARLPDRGKVLYADWIMQAQGVIPRDPSLY